MGAFIWGMVGGAIVLMVNRHRNMQVAVESARKNNTGILGRIRFCVSETVEDFRDLVAESKHELAAEKAAVSETRAQSEIEG